MGKEKTEFEEKFVSKTEKAKKLWEKRITENTTLSMESVQWMAQRINSVFGIHAIRICIDSLPKAGRQLLHGKRNPCFLRKRLQKET